MIISLLLFIVSVFFYALSQNRVFKESYDWERKYKKPFEPAPVNWYYKLTGLKYKERFPLSGSLLVAFTDKYHAYQLGFKAFLCASIVFYRPWLNYWDAVIYFVFWGVVFTLVFRQLD